MRKSQEKSVSLDKWKRKTSGIFLQESLQRLAIGRFQEVAGFECSQGSPHLPHFYFPGKDDFLLLLV
jgi:hypothetical protein